MPVGLYAGANVSNGNGVTTAFPYNFKILDQTHLEVKVDGVLKVLGSDYTVTGVGFSNGGNVNFVVAPANGAVVQRARKVPIKRDQDYQNNGDFKEITVDNDLDTIEMQVQQIAADIARAFKAPLSVTADQVISDADWAAAAGKFLRRKNDGSGIEFVAASPDDDTFTAGGVGAVPRSWSAKVGEVVSAEDFGAVGNGVTDDRVAIQKAIDAVRAAGGGDVVFGPHAYLIGSVASPDTMANGLLVPYSANELNNDGVPKRVRLVCTRQTRFLAGANNMVVIRFADSLGAVIGFPSIEANGHAGVWGFGLVPENMAQIVTKVFQCYNKLEIITRDTDEGLVMQGGPTVAGADSGCWYNDVFHFHWGGKRGRWLKDTATAAAVVTNRNTFRGRVGTGSNTGIHIDNGDTNKDYTHYEGITAGVLPNATPTAIVVKAHAGTGNAFNEFYGMIEACTRYVENADPNTRLFLPSLDETKVLFTAKPEFINGFLSGTGEAITTGLVRVRSSGATHVDLSYEGNDAQRAQLRTTSGKAANFNGVWLGSNEAPDGSQGNPGLTSWAFSLDGKDKTAYLDTADSFSLLRRPAGGAYSEVFNVRAGTRAGIANLGAAVIPCPTRRPMLLLISSNANLNQSRLYMVSGDGAAGLTYTSITDTTGGTLTITASTANSVTVTNTTGGLITLTWGIEAIGTKL